MVANGIDFADAAMGANFLSGYFGPGPVLLTRLQAVVAVFGTSGEVSRYSGSDRYATGAAGARSAYDGEANWPAEVDGLRTAFLVSGISATDALAAAPLTYALHGAPPVTKFPLLLTDPDVLSVPTRDALRLISGGNRPIQQVIVISGPGTVSPAVLTQVRTLGISPRRIQGVGGPGAVSDAVVAEARTAAGG